MKVLAVSDTVVDHLYQADVRARYPDVELLIGCGDLPYYYLDFLVDAFNVPMFYVLGNHDFGPQYVSDGRVLKSVSGGRNLHARVENHDGMIVGGLQGSMRYRPNHTLMYTNNEMWGQIGRMLPKMLWNLNQQGRALDVLVSHSPPFGIHDESDIAHTGFKAFLGFMRAFKPRYLLHGHVHRYRNDVPHVTQYHQTQVINVYPYAVLDLDLE